MSAQPVIDPVPATRPRWVPTVVPTSGIAHALTTAPTAEEVAALRPATRASAWRRRIGAVAVLVLLAFLLTVAIGRVTAGAELADPVAGTVTIGPGETLWDVATATAPAGVDAREQLEAINALNGFDRGEAIAPWTVVLLPAR